MSSKNNNYTNTGGFSVNHKPVPTQDTKIVRDMHGNIVKVEPQQPTRHVAINQPSNPSMGGDMPD